MSLHQRRTPLAAKGEPALWLTGAALVLSMLFIAGILVLILYRGAATFWPGPIDKVTLRDGETFYGVPSGSESYTPSDTDAERIEELMQSGIADPRDEEGLIVRTRYRVGNRDLGQESFRWVQAYEIASTSRPDNAVMIERSQWGVFIGEPEALLTRERKTIPQGGEIPTDSPSGIPPAILGYTDNGGTQIAEFKVETVGAQGIADAFPKARKRRQQIDRLNNVEIPRLQQRLDTLTWGVRDAELELEAHADPDRQPVKVVVWAAGLVVLVGLVAVTRVKPAQHGRWKLALPLIVLAGLFVLLENPLSGPDMTQEKFDKIQTRAEARKSAILAQQADVLQEMEELRDLDSGYRALIRDPRTGRIAPVSQAESQQPMLVSQIDRMVLANQLGFGDRLGVYFGRWGDFLSQPPGEAPGSGGVYPVILGTVILTLLLTISVVPLGVIAALYLREYARQGIATSIVRVAINNLAGVPSIVYGMFGLGFFCYTLGGYIDAGPGDAALARPEWWGGMALLAGCVTLAVILWMVGARDKMENRSRRWLGTAIGACWLVAAGLAGWMIFTTPYFHGFFAEKLPTQPTFGGRGILWASLTLALLTLPVVIVATEEAIAAVPGSMREGSFGCGASRWQTIRLIVLPAAMPGIMTGAILAMARGAGEVAPLMLVGAVNLAPTLPVSAEPPFLHGDRTFMHLGFHIYNLGFQSPDAEATEPLVWTITLLLVAIVFALNLIAVMLRAKLRRGVGAVV